MTADIEVVHPVQSIARQDELSVEQVIDQVQKIQQVMAKTMKDGEHYGVIPGTNKPSLLKPGAEKLCLTFRLAPSYEDDVMWDDEHMTVISHCKLTHIPTGNLVAAGEGMCSTKESKYAYRNANRKCPECGAEAIIKGKEEYGGGWVCFKKKQGCGAKFRDGDSSIEVQEQGKVPNPDLADSYNTVLKMACKRALIAAVLNGTAASDIFTQDIEDSPGGTPASTPQTKLAESSPGRDVEEGELPPSDPGAGNGETSQGTEDATGARGTAGSGSSDSLAVLEKAVADHKISRAKLTVKLMRHAIALGQEPPEEDRQKAYHDEWTLLDETVLAAAARELTESVEV